MNLEQQLGDLLRRDAATLPLRAPGVAVVKRRARQRQLRHRAGMAAMAAGVMGAAATTVSRIGGDDASTNISNGGDQIGTGEGGGTAGGEVAPPPVDGAQPAAETASGGFDVQVVPGTFGFVNGAAITDGAGRSYVLSTAPAGGAVDENGFGGPALYSSPDGATWDVASGFDQVPWASNLAASGDRVYAIGTAPAVSDDGLPAATAQVGWSGDGGQTWSTQEFAIDFPAPAATVPFVGRYVNTSIAASGNGTLVAVVDATWQLDFSSLLPDELSYPSVSDQGVDIIRAEGCDSERGCVDEVLDQLSWADLGLTGPGDTRRTFLFTSTDGEAWSEVAADFTSTGDTLTVVGTPTGFYANAVSYPTKGADGYISTDGVSWQAGGYISTDGVSWQPGGDLLAALGTDYVDQLGLSDGRLTATGYPGRMATSDDGGLTWQPATTVPWIAERTALMTIGPLGVAAVVDDGVTKSIWLSADGTGWELVTDVDPAVLSANPYVAALTVGANHVAATFTDVYAPADGGPSESVAIVATPIRG